MKTEQAMSIAAVSSATMSTTTKVLLCSDGSEEAGRAAAFLARTFPPGSAEVRVVVVLSYELYPYATFGHLDDEAERERNAWAAVTRTAATAFSVLSDAGLPATVARRYGYTPEAIIDEVNEWQPDLLVLGRRGIHWPMRWVESVSEHVLHQVDVPVLLVP